jgi:hypothetical protein
MKGEYTLTPKTLNRLKDTNAKDIYAGFNVNIELDKDVKDIEIIKNGVFEIQKDNSLKITQNGIIKASK